MFVAAFLNGFGQPVITKQPQSQSVSLGARVVFLAEASGTSPLIFQWRLKEVDLPGENASSLVLTNVQLSHAGGYTVMVSNLDGTVTSDPGTLTVDPTFTKITSGNPVTEAGYYTGCSWGDFDGDGF